MGRKFPCSLCNKSVKVNQKGLKCTECKKWVHISCNGISEKLYNDQSEQFLDWECRICTMKHLPFFGQLDIQQIVTKEKRDQVPKYTSQNKGFKITQLSKGGLNCAHLNVVSLVKNVDEINSMLCNNNIHIFAVNESRLDGSIQDSEVHIKGTG